MTRDSQPLRYALSRPFAHFVLPGLDMVVTILVGRYKGFKTGYSLGTRILREHVVPR